MQLLDSYNSNKIRFLSSFLIMMVVYLHGYYLEGEKYPISSYIQTMIGGGICGVANYMFFLISGYLFFLNVNGFCNITKKISKRVRSLFVPYILWNSIFVLWYLVLYTMPSVVTRFVNGTIINELKNSSISEQLYLIFIKPAAFHLWFLRDLMVLVLSSPIIWYATKKNRIALPLIMVIAGIFVEQFNFWAMFVIGGLISSQRNNLNVLTRKLMKAFPLCLIIFLTAAIVYPLNIVYLKHFAFIISLTGIIVIWCLYDILKIDANKYRSILGFSFFIYCFHMPFFNIIKKINLYVFGENQFNLILLYVINPLIAVAAIIVFAKTFKFIWPNGYLVLTGHRK